jgi:hypothetical protein
MTIAFTKRNMTTPIIKPQWHRMTAQTDGLGESPFWHPAENRL